MASYIQDDRQVRIHGWGQEGQAKIRESRPLVMGSDVLSQMLLVNLAGLGVGNIMLMDNQRITREDRYNFLYKKEFQDGIYIGNKRGKQIKEIIEKINNNISLIYRHSKFREAWLYDFKPSIIFDTTNSAISKREALSYSLKNDIPFINICSDENKAIITEFNPKDKCKKDDELLESIILSEFCDTKQGPIPSGIMAGLAAEELRKHAINLNHEESDNPLKSGERITYNLYSDSRTSLDSDTNPNPLGYYRDVKALLIGAGAIGNYAALNLSLIGIGKIDILDGDIIKDHNLNRQFAFYDRVKEDKAKVLSERIKEFNPTVKSDYFVKMLDSREGGIFSNNNPDEKYDLVFGCVDNLEARKLINQFCVQNSIHLIDGSTDALKGQVAVYDKRKKRCLDCQFDYDSRIEQRNERRKNWIEQNGNSCIDATNPSVVIPNIIIGSAMVGEGLRILYDRYKQKPLEGYFKYKSNGGERISKTIFRGYLKNCGAEK